MKRTKVRGIFFPLIGVVAALFVGVGFIACSDGWDEPPAAVAESSIRYDGTKFTWTASEYANKYTLLVDEKERSTNNTQFGYKCGDEETVSITITAVNDAGASAAVTRTFTKLETITDISFDENGIMSWDAVDGASSYEVSVNNKSNTVDTTEFTEFSYGERNAIKVRPLGDDTNFSFWSETVNKEYLGAPTDIDYDGLDLTWKGNSAAAGYTVYINGSEEGKSTKSSYRYDSNGKDFDVYVVANGDGVDSFNSKDSVEKSYTYLGIIDEIELSDGKLTWSAVAGATSYKVKVNNVTQEIRKTEFELTENVVQTIQIQPYAKNTDDKFYFAEWSESKAYKLLRRPTLSWESDFSMNGQANRAVSWSNVDDANGYEVSLTDPSGTTSIASRNNKGDVSFAYAFTEVGRYTVKVKALAALEADTCDSRWSEPIMVERLPAPKADTIPVTSNENNLSDGFKVHFTPVTGANGYRLYKEGTQTTINAQNGANEITVKGLVDKTITDEQHITYELQSIGSNRIISGQSLVTLDSLLADQGNSSPRRFDITILARPQNVDISGYNVTWDAINGADGYAVQTIGNKPDIANNATFDLNNIRSSCSMQICSRGNGTNVLASNYTPAISLVKLAKPTNIKANTEVSNGTLSCDIIDGATGYEIYYNGDTNNGTPSNNQPNINSKITPEGVYVVMKALANRWDDPTTKTKYFITSDFSDRKDFIKLNAPNNLRFENNQFIWSEPSNIDKSVKGIKYDVYSNGDGSALLQTLDGTRISTDSLAGGKAHTFTVRCIGDGSKFLSSDLSEVKVVTKLATPVIKQENDATTGYGKYTWTDTSAKKSITIGSVGNYEVAANVTEFIPKFAKWNSSYKITFIAVGDNTNTINSSPAEITQVLKRLNAPSLTSDNVKYVSDTKDMNQKYAHDDTGKIQVTLPAKDANSLGYKIVGTETVIPGTEVSTTDLSINTTGKHEIQVVALGGKFDSDGVYWFDSAESDKKTINIFAATNENEIMKTSTGIKWASVTDATYYQVEVTYKNKTSEGTETLSTETFMNKGAAMVASALTEKNINLDDVTAVTVRALGDGVSTITSKAVSRTIS